MKKTILIHVVIGLLALSPALFGARSGDFSLDGTERLAVTVTGNFDESLTIINTDTNSTVFYSGFLATVGGDWTTTYEGFYDTYGSGAVFEPGSQGCTLSNLPSGNYYISTSLGSGASYSYSSSSGNSLSLSDYNYNWNYGATCDVVPY